MEDVLSILVGLLVVFGVVAIYVGARRQRAQMRYAAEIDRRIRRDQIGQDLRRRVIAGRDREEK